MMQLSKLENVGGCKQFEEWWKDLKRSVSDYGRNVSAQWVEHTHDMFFLKSDFIMMIEFFFRHLLNDNFYIFWWLYLELIDNYFWFYRVVFLSGCYSKFIWSFPHYIAVDTCEKKITIFIRFEQIWWWKYCIYFKILRYHRWLKRNLPSQDFQRLPIEVTLWKSRGLQKP